MNKDKLKQLAEASEAPLKGEIDNAIYAYNQLERKNNDLTTNVKSLH